MSIQFIREIDYVILLCQDRDQDFGHRTLFFQDPEGNLLEIYREL
ncbi:MAG: hypothetical protein OEU36_06590 [Gammaproteobacteria bacterium]|nr:hypothetical protein [Gammaproteobacteria bacterium]